MHALARNPSGCIAHLPLDHMIWRLELATSGPYLGLALRYVLSNTTALMMLAAWDVGQENITVADNVAKTGLPFGAIEKTSSRLYESLKILHNSKLKPQQVEDIISQSRDMAQAYFDIIQAVQLGAAASGSFNDWSWVISPQLSGWQWPSKPAKTPVSDD